MARLVIDHPAPPGGWDEVRPRLKTALANDLPVRLEERWDAESVHLTGAGARASIRMVDGRLRAEADLGPPASFFSGVIESRLRDALHRAWPVDGGGDPSERKA